MKLNREILRVKEMLERATTSEEMARLYGLLVSLQNEYIVYLEGKVTASSDYMRTMKQKLELIELLGRQSS